MPELYSVSINAGTPQQILTTPALEAKYSNNGKLLAYMDNKAYENQYRKHDISSFARDIWVYEKQSGKHKQLTQHAGGDSTPVWSNDNQHIFYLSEQESNNFNVWKMPATGGAAKRITDHKTHPVRSLSISNAGLLAYTWHGNIYTVTENEKSKKLNISLKSDSQYVDVQPTDISKQASEFLVSPYGKVFAFISMG
jgi:Tol biopolymer transport system component